MKVAKGGSVTVRVPDGLNLDQCKTVLTSVLTKVGHPYCFSGFKIAFDNSIDYLTVQPGSTEVSEVER
jgi:hypothetical protein